MHPVNRVSVGPSRDGPELIFHYLPISVPISIEGQNANAQLLGANTPAQRSKFFADLRNLRRFDQNSGLPLLKIVNGILIRELSVPIQIGRIGPKRGSVALATSTKNEPAGEYRFGIRSNVGLNFVGAAQKPRKGFCLRFMTVSWHSYSF